MGCTVSKLDNEDTVRRCKERRRLMKEAVYARHHLASAHSDYCRSLRNTGSALVTFASGEPISVSDHTPAVLLRNSSSISNTTAANTSKPTFIPPPRHIPSPSPSFHPPPPPPPLSTTSTHRSHHQQQPTRLKKSMKLPHILSDSSFSSSPPPTSHNFDGNFTYDARANSTYSNTPSQASSVWNWENFYPPSPPDSEYFQNLHTNKNTSRIIQEESHYGGDDDDDDKESSLSSFSNTHDQINNYQNPSSNSKKQFDDKASNYSSYSRYSDSGNSYVRNHPKQGPVPVQKKGHRVKNWESEEEETEREEVQCSEWGDHDHHINTTSSSDEDEAEDLRSRSDFGSQWNYGSVKNEPAAAAADVGNLNANLNSKPSSKSGKLSSDDNKSSVGWGNRNDEGMNSDRRIVVRHKNLVEIVAALKEYFDKAASAGEQVSEMLEIGRAQLDRSFKQLKKTLYHSSGMLSNLSSTWTSKPPLAVKYRLEPSSLDQPGGPKSLFSTLERLLAWEKKLYEEVKVLV
ncbi:nitrate regulatory gene2 protein-like [Olea europaea var. sylvestris]|uniref:nitrate regulatory gene2 protein-like n=1 Tax=Olea europaea var. sylvestris TaxID=158386 RepID=UPI000C1D6D5E|nr:nitrate regulatory gene2 protein-like [Olea europaea var. sylvestris]